MTRKKTCAADRVRPAGAIATPATLRPWFLAATLAVPACALTQQDEIYAGDVVPVAGTCDAGSRGTLTLRHRAVQFAPSSGVLVLTGTVAQGGAVIAAAQPTGFDKSAYRLLLTARLTDDGIVGEYRTPRCRYAVRLRKS